MLFRSKESSLGKASNAGSTVKGDCLFHSVPNGAQLEEDELECEEELQSMDESKTHFETVLSI